NGRNFDFCLPRLSGNGISPRQECLFAGFGASSLCKRRRATPTTAATAATAAARKAATTGEARGGMLRRRQRGGQAVGQRAGHVAEAGADLPGLETTAMQPGRSG